MAHTTEMNKQAGAVAIAQCWKLILLVKHCSAFCVISLCLGLFTIVCTTAAFAGPNPSYPLKISENHRYFVDQHDRPFLMQGDAAWSLIVGTTNEEAEQYLENRREKGFNAVIVNLIEHKFVKEAPKNRYGDEPFLTRGDFSTPNEAYFKRADWVVKRASEKGILVLLAPAYLGFTGTDEGWFDEVLKNGPQKCKEYGRYVASRYKDFDNVIWVMGGDHDPREAMDSVRAMALGIKGVDSRHLFTAHLAPEHSALDKYDHDAWLDFGGTYSYYLLLPNLLRDYNRQPPMPFILLETRYEGEWNTTPPEIRRQAYWAILNGGTGQFLGNSPLWQFDPGWQAAMDAAGSAGMAHLKALFESRKWYDLVPDQEHEAVTSGYGRFTEKDYVAAALTSDRSTMIAYLPTGRAITVDLSRIAGKEAKIWWFDPSTGEARSSGTLATTGSRKFSPPGTGDWVLVIDDGSSNFPRPGSPR